MAEKFVIRDADESKVRWIAEPRFLARLRRLKAIWNAVLFIARGGKFKVYLDFSGIDPRILKPVKVTIGHDGRVLDLERERHNAVASSARKMEVAGLALAADDEPGFRVRWRDWTRKTAWEEAGFDVAHTSKVFVVTPKEVPHA